MQIYANQHGDSGVTHFEIHTDSIVVRFRNGRCYLYTSAGVGANSIESMKELALAGRGLSTFIARHPDVKQGYGDSFEC